MAIINAVLSNEIISVFADFIDSDWVASAGFYILDVQHNLDSQSVNATLWENGTDLTTVSRISIVNNNTIRLFVTIDPDCRFSGRIIIFKTQE